MTSSGASIQITPEQGSEAAALGRKSHAARIILELRDEDVAIATRRRKRFGKDKVSPITTCRSPIRGSRRQC